MSGAVASTQVARKIFDLADGQDPTLTALKLMKLTYIVHGWFLGITCTSLINEDVYAWKNGPVFPELFDQIKKYENKQVKKVPISKRERHYKRQNPSGLSGDQAEFIETVYDDYKHMSGKWLSDLTHENNTPWDITRRRNGLGVVIGRDLIQQYYAEFL